MQQVWDLMMSPLVKVNTLAELRGCTDNIAYMDRKTGSTTMQIYAMPQGHSWPLAGPKSRYLLVRACWLPLWDEVLRTAVDPDTGEETSSRGVMVSGTPGVGTSYFSSFVLLKRAQQHAKAGGTTVLHSGPAATVTTFVGGRVKSALRQYEPVFVYRATPTSPKPWYIYDPCDTGGGGGGFVRRDNFTLITAAPDPKHYKALRNCGSPRLFMQPWSLAELQAVAPLMLVNRKVLSAKEVERRFQQVGGVPRYVFAGNYQDWLDEFAREIYNCDLRWVARQMRSTASTVAPSEKHMLFTYTVADTEKPHTIKVDLASQYVYQGMLSKARKLSRWQLMEFAMDYRIGADFRWRLMEDLQCDWW